MRGKVGVRPLTWLAGGIIPAHAGKSNQKINYPQDARGSSPLMRGKGSKVVHALPRIRIIPAHAGKRAVKLFAAAAAEDHPRSCGEKLFLLLRAFIILGSSPLMRGKGLLGGCSDR